MNNNLLQLINKIRSDRRLSGLEEAPTKQVIVLPILHCLNWDLFNIDEVYPEYSVGDKRVDYALRHNGKNKVFIEVKRINEELERHQGQLLEYSFQEGVKLAILTNGISWWFYLPLNEGSWEQRKFYTIELYAQEVEDITQKFVDFLSKENVISDKAVKNAEGLYKSQQREHLIRETLPKAWNKLIAEPDDLLVELLAETTEKLCGYKPDAETVHQFLIPFVKKAERIKRTKGTKGLAQLRGKLAAQLSSPEPKRREDYTGTSIAAFVFRQRKYEVSTWKSMLIQLCDIILSTHKDRFENVLTLVGRKRPYFSKNPNELRQPEKIEGTDIYVETNLSANNIVQLSRKILFLFGYREDDVRIIVK